MKFVNGIALPDYDTHFATAILAGPIIDGKGTYQLQKLQNAVKQVPEGGCGEGSVAVDIGAHVGLWSRVLRMYFDTVIAFEPVPALAACFRENVRDAELHEVALAGPGTNGSQHAFTLVAENTGNSRMFAQCDNTTPIAPPFFVPVRTLDSYELARLDFLKIDVEGFELRVVEGAHDTIRLNKPVIIVEQKPGHAERYGYGQTAAVNLLRSWGYEIAWVKAGDYCMKWGRP